MINTIAVIVSTILSVFAFGISVYNLILQKRKIVAEAMVNNRTEWMNNIRRLMLEFLECYYTKQDSERLQLCKTKIELYTRRDSPAYKNLNKALNFCVNDEFSEENYDRLIVECQKVLNDVWIRAKIESGISTRQDKRMYKLFAKKNKIA
ncbi:MAG: hypothetical protein ACLRZ9_06100 [Eubacterium sp.]